MAEQVGEQEEGQVRIGNCKVTELRIDYSKTVQTGTGYEKFGFGYTVEPDDVRVQDIPEVYKKLEVRTRKMVQNQIKSIMDSRRNNNG